MANIQDVRTVNNPQRAFEFEVEIVANTVIGNIPILTQRVETVSIPEKTLEVIEINYKGRKTFHAGRDASAHTVIVSFWDDEDQTVYNFFNNWIENINNSEVGGGLTRDLYAADMNIRRFAHNSETVVALNRLTKVFPTSIGDIQLSYETSEHMKVEVTFSYDSNILV